MGGTVGIAIGQTLYTSVLRRKINKIPGLRGLDTSAAALSESVRTLRGVPVSDDTNPILGAVFLVERTISVATRKRADYSRLYAVY